ncbi:MAG: hypothetical protein RJA70_1031 [Pseudomonadota bacterium]|jgi:hypothetical protein
MALKKFGFIVTGAGLDPAKHRTTLESSAFGMLAVGVSKPEQGIAVAQAMVADGIQLIELCGGFGPIWTAKILAAIGEAVPVGSVGYGPEAIEKMHALFS